MSAQLIERDLIESTALLDEASKQLASALLDYPATMQAVARVGVPALADWCALDLFDEDGTIHRLALADVDPTREAHSLELAKQSTPSSTARFGIPQVLRTGRSVLLAELTDDFLAGPARDAEDVKALRALGFSSGMIVPLVARDRILGTLTFATEPPRPAYTEDDVRRAKELASRCALALDNARRYREALAAVEERDALLASVSHDLKNPLSTISGQAQLLRRAVSREGGPLADRMNEGLSRIESTVVRMTRMIDELLDVARLEVGARLDLERSPIELSSLVRRKVAEYQRLTTHHRFRIGSDGDLVGNWDAARLERVMDNLLGNAIKYTPGGGVINVIVVRDEDETGRWAILSVRDPGVGIPAADLPRIFERFHRAGNVAGIGGAGLGLSVTRHIIEQHGGTVSVDSREGQGSAFTVRLPLIA